jgi:hypothetical protein
MEKKRLLESLEQLHAEIARGESVDQETLAQLRAQIAKIERVIDARAAPSAEKAEPVSHGLNDLLLKFESEHPQLAVAVGRVADALAAMGI